MRTLRFFLILIAYSILTCAIASGGAPALQETCYDTSNMKVATIYDPYVQVFAEVRRLPKSERIPASQAGVSSYMIYVNPERYYLGRQTQQWLYQRQCVHIIRGHAVAQSGLRGLNIKDEEVADCQAARDMSNAGLSSRDLYSIERDIERIAREGLWNQVLPGPQRRVSLSSCK